MLLRDRLFSCAVVVVLPFLLAGASFAEDDNPAAPGFNAEASDPEAIALADDVMERLGGREAWDRTRYVTWNFFGRRRHLWDKHTGRIRVEGSRRDDEKPYVILMSIHDGQGRAWIDGSEVVDPAEREKMLDLAVSAWINDSYWMFMPYKLKDTGVTLRHLGAAEMLDGRSAEILQLTFDGVGETPENKYLVYVGRESGLVEQWDYFANAADAEPAIQTPWHNWKRYGEILLSDDRGESGHSDIAVLAEIPPRVLTSPEPVDWDALVR